MRKLQKVDVILLIGVALIAIVSAFIDVNGGTNFPVYSILSITCSYGLLVVLYLFSTNKYLGKPEKPVLVEWYTFLFLHLIHGVFAGVGLILAGMLSNIFKS